MASPTPSVSAPRSEEGHVGKQLSLYVACTTYALGRGRVYRLSSRNKYRNRLHKGSLPMYFSPRYATILLHLALAGTNSSSACREFPAQVAVSAQVRGHPQVSLTPWVSIAKDV
mmetsp:Transcript_30233/g.76466  ORF Transcript_30233/g.76466 Transcript_30233/m.76466 type:complete len:114 (-) Transcript_30233:98-439(-)